jgi:hypothetical protein
MRLDFNAHQIGSALSALRTYSLNYRLPIGIIFCIILILIYPILLIPLFGGAVPIFGGWLTLKSLMEDRQEAKELEIMQDGLKTCLERTIATHSIIDIPLKAGMPPCAGLITKFDAIKIYLIDISNNTNFSISWNDIDVRMLYYRMTGLKKVPEREIKNASSNNINSRAKNFLLQTVDNYSRFVSAISKFVREHIGQ